MRLDLRLPIGLLFSIIGMTLVVYGLVSVPALAARSLGININLISGYVMLAFGAAMLSLTQRDPSPVKTPGRDNTTELD